MIETQTNPSTRQAPSARRIVQGIVNAALVVWAVRDIRRRGEAELKGNRRIWLAAAFAPPFGPIAYFLFGRKRDAQTELLGDL